MNALPSNEPSSRLIRDRRRVPVFRPVPTDPGAGALLASRIHHPDVLAISSAGSRCRGDLYCDFHGQMIRRGPEPCALQRDRLARVMRDRDADEVLISHNAARWIEVDPARTGHVDLHPGVHVAADEIVVIIVGQMHISRDEPRRKSTGAQRSDHQDRELATAPTAHSKRPYRILNALLMPRDVLETSVYGVGYADEKFVRADGSVPTAEQRAPAIDLVPRM